MLILSASQSIFCFFYLQISRVHNKSTKLHAKAKMADFKLSFVPLIFLVLRMWGFALSIPHYYLTFSTKQTFRRTTYNAILVLLAVSVCGGRGEAHIQNRLLMHVDPPSKHTLYHVAKCHCTCLISQFPISDKP